MAPEGAGGRLDLASLSCEEDIEAAFLKLDKEEAAVGDELAGVLEQQIRLDTRLKGVLAMAPRLNDVAGDAEQLSKLVTHTAGLAERVAAKVWPVDRYLTLLTFPCIRFANWTLLRAGWRSASRG